MNFAKAVLVIGLMSGQAALANPKVDPGALPFLAAVAAMNPHFIEMHGDLNKPYNPSLKPTAPLREIVARASKLEIVEALCADAPVNRGTARTTDCGYIFQARDLNNDPAGVIYISFTLIGGHPHGVYVARANNL